MSRPEQVKFEPWKGWSDQSTAGEGCTDQQGRGSATRLGLQPPPKQTLKGRQKTAVREQHVAKEHTFKPRQAHMIEKFEQDRRHVALAAGAIPGAADTCAARTALAVLAVGLLQQRRAGKAQGGLGAPEPRLA
eukprot:350941-Chlamydomonas_euryale.AAC.17